MDPAVVLGAPAAAGPDAPDTPPLPDFHPAVAAWFARRFPSGPTPPQVEAWPQIAAGLDTLVSAPTGSGKTLAAFLVPIDRLYRAHERGEPVEGTHVLYASPLRALALDIKENLERPLAEIAAEARRLGLDPPELTVAVRSGDSTPAERAALLRRPPTFLVTTPESLYLLLTAARARQRLTSVATVIVDEIHALARDKRGSHLALSLERLDHLVTAAGGSRPRRIGLSATQRPIETVARFLVGDGRPCRIADCGHRQALDLALELPDGELEAVMSGQQMGEVVDRLAELVGAHRTTLVFVNTRRLAERLAHQLGERLGSEVDGDVVAAHHGSLSKQRRHRVEARLRAGELRALVATASLELGIDIGPIELVCQIGSPRSLATFLQRVGRSNHRRAGTPSGRLFPLTRDELVECAALLGGVREGRLDALHPPEAPLDILAQQLVAEVAAAPDDASVRVDELFELVRRAAPYAALRREDFDRTLAFMSDGVATGRGRRAQHLHHDRVNGEVRARRGARLAALTSGGAIPEVADYRVVAEPDDVLVGTVNEDWAIESMAGDVFLLGTHSWRIRRVESGVVRVVDADGADPTIPFWLGESPGRTTELSEEVSRLRAVVGDRLAAGDPDGARDWLGAVCGVPVAAAEQIVAYLAAGRAALGSLPTRDHLVVERFFDDTGGMQLVVHCPYGARLNRGFGLALRKRLCVTFDFELQAAANDDALVLSLGPQHSFPLEDVVRFVRAGTVGEVLQQAVLVPPFAMFTSRWRWNLNRSLAVLRWKGGRRNPPAIQRMEADDLMAALFPAAAACQENASGPLTVPDHPVVTQTLSDTMTEALDLAGLQALLADVEAGRVTVSCRDTTEPSPLAHELVSGRPFTYLDDAPLEERRTRAVTLRRGLPVDLAEIGAVDPAAIERVRAEVRPDPRNADELADLLAGLVVQEAVPSWQPLLDSLVARHRAHQLHHDGRCWWVAADRLDDVLTLWPDATADGAARGDARAGSGVDRGGCGAVDPEDTACRAVEGHLEVGGPLTVDDLARRTGLRPGAVAVALGALEARGTVIQGRFSSGGTSPPDAADDPSAAPPTEAPAAVEWCARRLLQRIHVYSQKRRRREIEPVSARDFMRFLFRWQHVTEATRRRGADGLLAVVEQLQGWEAAAGDWEPQLLRARVQDYRPSLLDQRCHAGDVIWARLSLPDGIGAGTAGRLDELDGLIGLDGHGRDGNDLDAVGLDAVSRDGRRVGGGPGEDDPTGRVRAPSRATPISLCGRDDFAWLLVAARGSGAPAAPGVGALAEIVAALRASGARFHRELAVDTGRLPTDIERALWEGVSRGLLTADGFHAVRSLLDARQVAALSRTESPLRRRTRLRRGAGDGARARVPGEGRWALLPPAAVVEEPDELAEAVAEQLLARWGVLFRDLALRERLAVPWRDVQWALRRLEARGVIRGGRFVHGFSGEQYATPEAVELLRQVRKAPLDGERVTLAAGDPLNLSAVVVPGCRLPALSGRTTTWCDGLPVVAGAEGAAAVEAAAGFGG